MAERKRKSPTTSTSKPVQSRATPRPAQVSAPAPTQEAIGNRLLREAAWSRMFGRTDAKNPFAR